MAQCLMPHGYDLHLTEIWPVVVVAVVVVTVVVVVAVVVVAGVSF